MKSQTMRKFKDVRINVAWGYVVGRWYGNNQTRPILAIHGWQDNIGTWETLVPLMPQHIGVLCIDLPGHGQSSHMPRGMTYHAIDFVHIVVRIMEEYNWKKVSLMCHSMGSIVGFIFSALFPHKVDMFLAIDVIQPFQRSINNRLRQLRMHSERLLIEDERHVSGSLKEPPSYTYEDLERLLYEASYKSIELEKCKYILNRSITKSTKCPDKYYFSRDGRLKNYVEFFLSNELSMEMARKMVNIPYLVLNFSESMYISELSLPFIELMQKQNPQFEFYKLPGTHHTHLNNPKAVAAVLNPFINHYRPVRLISWSLTEDTASNESDNLNLKDMNKGTKSRSKL